MDGIDKPNAIGIQSAPFRQCLLTCAVAALSGLSSTALATDKQHLLTAKQLIPDQLAIERRLLIQPSGPTSQPSTLIDKIVNSGFTPSDYQVPEVLHEAILSDTQPGHGHAARQPIFLSYSTDYTQKADPIDIEPHPLTWDIHHSFSQQDVSYLQDTTSGLQNRLIHEQSHLQADFVKPVVIGSLLPMINLPPLNLGFGLDFQENRYTIPDGLTPNVHPFGEQLDEERIALYIGLDTNITDRFSIGGRVRYEDFSNYDPTLNWHITTRFEITSAIAISATANTGYQTPALLNNADLAASVLEFLPREVDQTEATQYTLGLAFTPWDSTSITIDYSDIEVGNRRAPRQYNAHKINGLSLDSRQVLTLSYSAGRVFSGLVRINRFDEDTRHYLNGAAELVDIEGRITFSETYSMTLGGENVFDVESGKEKSGMLQFHGTDTVPFSQNRGFWYVRGTANF